MNFGFSLIMRGKAACPHAFVTMAQQAESLGIDSVWASDHLILPKLTKSLHPHSQTVQYPQAWMENYWESITTLSFLAAKTTTLTLGFSISVLPTHNPIELAKQIACLDQLSHGRVILGTGVGWCEEEYAALGVPFRQRGARANEALALFETLWQQEPASFEGRFYRFAKAYFTPKPLSPKGVPIWVGGNSAAALKRAARYADAYHPICPNLQGIGRLKEKLATFSSQVQRTKPPIKMSIKCPLVFTNTPPEQHYATQGSTAEVVDALGKMEEYGVSDVVFDLVPETLENALDVMARFARDVRPQLSMA